MLHLHCVMLLPPNERTDTEEIAFVARVVASPGMNEGAEFRVRMNNSASRWYWAWSLVAWPIRKKPPADAPGWRVRRSHRPSGARKATLSVALVRLGLLVLTARAREHYSARARPTPNKSPSGGHHFLQRGQERRGSNASEDPS